MNKLLLGLAAAVALLPAPAHAYKFLCDGVDAYGNVPASDGCTCDLTHAQRWQDGFIDWKVKRAGSPASVGGTTAWIAAVDQAYAGWNAVTCKNFTLYDRGDASSVDFGTNEGQHTAFWISTAAQWQQMVGGGSDSILGVTVTPYYFQNCYRWSSDTDFAMNGVAGFGWTTNMASCQGSSCTDVAAVVAHEVGHSMGMGHPCTGEGGPIACSGDGALMAAIAGYRQDWYQPLQDDINGICALYPGTPGLQGAPCTTTANCTGGRQCITDNNVKYCSESCTGATCPTGYSCQDNLCKRALPGIGQACTGSCVDGAMCLQDGSGGSQCYKTCNPSATPNGCNTATERCYDLDDQNHQVGACVAAGNLRPGENCAQADCEATATCYITDWDGASATTCTADAQCSNGMICNTAGSGATKNHCVLLQCLQNCQQDTECPSGQRCDTGSCIGARLNGTVCGEAGIFSLCNTGLICLCNDQACANGTCRTDCTANASLCLSGYVCETLSSSSKACLPTALEGQPCNAASCLAGLQCVTDAPNNGAHCYVDCAQASCPEGKFCNVYNQGTQSQFSICETHSNSSSSSGNSSSSSSSSSSGGGSSGASSAENPSSGAVSSSSSSSSSSGGGESSSAENPSSSGGGQGLPVGTGCSNDPECASGMCAEVNGSRVCTASCSLDWGNRECAHGADHEGCVPVNPDDWNQGGRCAAGVAGDTAVGQPCDANQKCQSGMCWDGACVIWCTDDGNSCTDRAPEGWTCDTSVGWSGVCRPVAGSSSSSSSGGGGDSGGSSKKCECARVGDPGTSGMALALLALGLVVVRRRR